MTCLIQMLENEKRQMAAEILAETDENEQSCKFSDACEELEITDLESQLDFLDSLESESVLMN